MLALEEGHALLLRYSLSLPLSRKSSSLQVQVAFVTDISISALFVSRITTDEAAHGGYFISNCFLLDPQVCAASELCRNCFSTTTSYNYGGFLLLFLLPLRRRSQLHRDHSYISILSKQAHGDGWHSNSDSRRPPPG